MSTISLLYFSKIILLDSKINQANLLYPPYKSVTLGQLLQAGLDMNKKNLWKALVANWYCWPVINLVNFHYIPVQFR